MAMSLGLRTIIYRVTNLDRAKAWYTTAFGVDPYFDELFYVGFNIGGYELGLDPDTSSAKPGPGGTVAYWGVANIQEALSRFLASGAGLASPVRAVGAALRVATVTAPLGYELG